MRKLLALIASLALAALPLPALGAASTAQSYVLTTCGSGVTYPAGTVRDETQDVSGAKCVSASVSASINGFDPTAGATAALAVSGTSADVALPAGADDVVQNTGTVDAHFRVTVGAGTAVTTDFVIKAGQSLGVHPGTATHLSAITDSSTTNLVIQGGVGLFTGVGGGSGSGGAVTLASGAVASGAYSAGSLAAGAGVDGWDVTQGAKADSACATSTGSCSVVALLKYLNSTVNADPCGGAKSFAPISLAASGQIITGTASKKTYICSINITNGGTAQNVALVEGTGTVCATNIFGLAGGTTAATGWQFGANGGETSGTGVATVAYGSGDANATAANVCLLLSSTVQVSGTIGYVQQ